ncbi:unnamed protein product [Tilletia controversa]|nr:hypothetical protein CF328_g4653 [Tilletia controversa]CAD6899679.1 unnamed protein product [Tilletia controversa]CAD6925143.1 unnamed protein product [Tilletia controversa]CAD6945581.1 unnamed protein product [Tilletia controversa]CAD6969979.1 unnamed protein product [Tilletia controversa]
MPAEQQTSKAVLRSLRHMLPSHLPSSYTKHQRRMVPTHMRHVPAFVHITNRIKYWNIVPGDEVKVRAGKSVISNDQSKIGAGRAAKVRGQGTVQTIDRTRNWVWLRDPDDNTRLAPTSIRHTVPRLVDPTDPSKGYTGTTTRIPRPLHYSNLMLKVPGTDLFASRVVRSSVRYDRTRAMFSWKRYGIVKKEDGAVERVEIPWPKLPSRKKELNETSAPAAVVNAQSFIPWAPEDPVHYPETFFNKLGRAYSTPAGEALAAKLRQLRLQDDNARIANAPNIKPSNTFPLPADAQGKYPGFEKLYGDPRSKQPRPIAQPPTPAETVVAATESRDTWASDPDVKAHILAGGNAFTPSDYLDLAPPEGPAMGGDWTYGTLSARPTHHGTPTTLQDVDTMPIELLMRKELANEGGLKWRMRARRAREEVEKVEREGVEGVRKRNLENLKMVLKIKGRSR